MPGAADGLVHRDLEDLARIRGSGLVFGHVGAVVEDRVRVAAGDRTLSHSGVDAGIVGDERGGVREKPGRGAIRSRECVPGLDGSGAPRHRFGAAISREPVGFGGGELIDLCQD